MNRKGYRSYLQADAFGGYDGIYAGGKVVEVGCNAHALARCLAGREDPSNHSRSVKESLLLRGGRKSREALPFLESCWR